MVRFSVPIRAIPQGSHKSFIVKGRDGKNRVVTTDNNHDSIMSSRVAIVEAYRNAGGINYGDAAIGLSMTFTFIRPKSVSAKKRPYMTVAPDTDKCCRMILDSLSKVAYNDDAQVITLTATKRYADEESITIDVHAFSEAEQSTI